MDPSFEGAGQEEGIEIWRIEDFKPIKYPSQEYGKFYSGDSYIVLYTKKSRGGSLSWNIHFWLGKETTQDESGTAAIKSVELDDSLGGLPVQHREVEEHESNLFLSYFKKGVRYLPGGVKSGFTHVDPDSFETRLFQVKGRRNIRVRQVETNVSAMNKGDCFILDCGKDIYVYMGPESRRTERLKAVQVANQVRDQDHAGKAKVHIVDEYDSGDLEAQFFSSLGSGSAAEVPEAGDDVDDVAHERSEKAAVTLYHITDSSGEMAVEPVAEKPLKQEILKGEGVEESEDCFLLDTGSSGIFAWIGKASSKNEKLHAMNLATKYLQEKNYPMWTKVERIVEGAEPAVFKQYFSQWAEDEAQVGLGRVYTKEQVAASAPELEVPDFDVTKLHAKKRRMLSKNLGSAWGFMPDDGSGTVEIWRIENFELAPLPEDAHGVFFGGDSYVLKYTYEKNGIQKFIVYFWQGLESTQDEKASSALWAVRLDDDVGGKAVQVRVVQGYEPQHFLKIFKGRMVVLSGGHASGFKNIHDYDSYDVDGTRMFRVRGTTSSDTRAVQVAEKASSLNADDVYVLETPAKTFVWYGEGASDEEKGMSDSVVEIVSPGREVEKMNEGEETEEFWGALGGKDEYPKSYKMPDTPLLGIRLFHCKITHTGKFRVEEFTNYTQEDLATDDVMVMDTGAEIFVWIGSGASEEEKKQSLKMAEDYVKTEPSDRLLENTIIITVKQGEEPDAYKALFETWDTSLWDNEESWEDIKNALQEANQSVEE